MSSSRKLTALSSLRPHSAIVTVPTRLSCQPQARDACPAYSFLGDFILIHPSAGCGNHVVIEVILVFEDLRLASAPLPLSRQQRTFVGAVGMSEKCQLPTSTPADFGNG
jgi:hypothetical protein